MDKKPLHALLEELHHQLHQAQPIDADERQLLQDLSQDIQAMLQRSGAGEALDQEAPVLARLNQAVRQFEVSHPHLTLALGQVIDTLSRAGL